ncbi:HET-domain-containing protein, partial [Cadophora sp. DSE1049]
MDSVQRYQYRPLVENDGIRLLELEPNPDLNAEVKCSLIHTTLHEYDHDIINHYTALSYVWGDSTATKSILVEGHEFHITLNLDTALRYIRDSTRRCLIWADAICINQLDDEEKNRQVRQMGYVYRNATHTIIFMGEPTDHTDAVLRAVRSGSSSSLDTQAREALPWQDILARPWFQRVWVYQE